MAVISEIVFGFLIGVVMSAYLSIWRSGLRHVTRMKMMDVSITTLACVVLVYGIVRIVGSSGLVSLSVMLPVAAASFLLLFPSAPLMSRAIDHYKSLAAVRKGNTFADYHIDDYYDDYEEYDEPESFR